MSGSNLSVQLYTVRTAIEGDLPGTLQRLAGIGFGAVELFGFVDRAEEYRDALSAAGLTAPSGHATLVDVDVADVIAAAETAGVGTVIDPYTEPARWSDRAGVEGIAQSLNSAAKVAADSGIRVGYHNHTFEFENRIDDVSALEYFAGLLDPAVVLEIDTYWAAVGGESDVPALLGRLGDRVQFLHIKDGPLTKVDADQLAVGRGGMPVDAILAAAPGALRVVELDDFTGDVFDAVADSYAYLTTGRNG